MPTDSFSRVQVQVSKLKMLKKNRPCKRTASETPEAKVIAGALVCVERLMLMH
jgi:hypothetical protein